MRKTRKIGRSQIGPPITAKLRLYGDDGRPIDKEVNFIPMGYLKPTGSEIDNEAFMRLEYAKELSKKEYYDGALVKVESLSLVTDTRRQTEKLGLATSRLVKKYAIPLSI